MGQFDNIDACRQRVEKIINGTSPVPGLSLILTYQQCLEYCGTGYGNYPAWSVVSALTDWVIPLFLLLGNITYSESSSFIFIFKGNNYGGQLNWIAVISHLLVNPFDFLLSLALKLDSGRSIKERVDRLGPALDIESEERKYLCGICYALEDFDYGVHVETLLASLEHKAPKDDTFDLSTFEEDINKSCTQFEANLNWESIRTILRPTARNIAAGRRHNKLHSTLAIIMYGKDVFIALIQGKCDENFPYHLPHTLALRQLYYWLFCAITLSAAAGGFANQWSSHAFLNEFLEARIFNLRNMSKNSSFQYTDIQLDRIEPWSGGNYHWRYRPPGYPFNITLRKTYLLLLVIAAIGSPIVIAFLMSWFTPTAGLGARGIAELSFAGMWVLNCILTRAVSWKWQGKDLFKIYLWNTFWSLASLFILFGAFQGTPLHFTYISSHHHANSVRKEGNSANYLSKDGITTAPLGPVFTVVVLREHSWT